ncbi:MAG: hypothetical protein M3Y87_28060 [Myxococcota bacterium]|nr:hypothetical protein [Myxococcota bacterium]
MAQRTLDPDMVAGPPDDGGFAGQFSTPQDEMVARTPHRPLGPHGESRQSPPLHRDETRTGTFGKKSPTAGLGVAGGTVFLMAVTAVAVALALLVAGG